MSKKRLKLSKNSQKQIAEKNKAIFGDKTKVISAQDTIPFQRMFQDGICRVSKNFYTKTIKFEDINYQSSSNDNQNAVFDSWCDFLNYFDPSIIFQLNYINTDGNETKASKVDVPQRNDSLKGISDELRTYIKNQASKGDDGKVKDKYLTFGISDKSIKFARPRINRIESELLMNFKRIGCEAEVLDGYERLKLFHRIFHMNEIDNFDFKWDSLIETGFSVKDFIAPNSFEFKNSNKFKIGNHFCKMSRIRINEGQMSDRVLTDLLNSTGNMNISIQIVPLEQSIAIKQIKKAITDVESSKIDAQKKAVKAGYDMDIMPPDLAANSKGALELLEQVQSRNERMFMMTFSVMNVANTEEELKMNVQMTSSIAQQHNCTLISYDFRQEEAFCSSLPLAKNIVENDRLMTTSATAIFIPFTTKDLFQEGNESLYYGVNSISKNIIMADRKALKNPNGLYFGQPGSGKSMKVKTEIVFAFLLTQDHFIIADPESEYGRIVLKFHGTVIKISQSSKLYINPFDINLNYSEGDDPLAFKIDFILSFCELILSSTDGLKPIEKTIIDRCSRNIYREYLNNPIPENVPILEDLYNELLLQPEKEAKFIATALEIYVYGSQNVFNHRTNVDLNNRLICFDLKDLGTQLKKIGMLIVQDQVWNRVTANRKAGITTRYYIDEMHLLLRNKQTAAYTVDIWKRFRKWGGVPTGITQNVKDIVRSPEVDSIFENSEFIVMLSQGPEDKMYLAEKLHISDNELSKITDAEPGQGLLYYGGTIIPFEDKLPKNMELYKLTTTKLEEQIQSIENAGDNDGT